MNFPIIETILGTQAELRAAGQLSTQTVQTVSVQWYETERNILRKTTSTGAEIAFRLFKEGLRLRHDDVVYIDDQIAVIIEIVPSEVIVLAPKTLPDMARACYEIGNKHSPLFLEGDELLLTYDKPMFEWLAAAGFAPQQAVRRLSNALRANSAQGHGHSHAHDHAHSHLHHHHPQPTEIFSIRK